MRLEKYLADCLQLSRSQIKKMISQKQVQVNGIYVKNSVNVNAKDEIKVNDEIIEYTEFQYYILNKPQGVVCANEDAKHPTIFDLMNLNKNKYFSFGRLDKDTEGLLIVSNDGKLLHELLNPKKHVKKTYYLEVNKPINDDINEKISSGIDIGEKKLTLPAEFVFKDKQSGFLTISEGKFHQVKRMMEFFDLKVTFLKRTKFGNLKLPSDLNPGEFRLLTTEEVEILKKTSL
ncbi:pseudouridine synthase [[Mycoplasma] gypis]|uniref:Pseudouridine synthase n=1 Tax=[Mycoplasma] gypis TaxID=92404 RepID=A0ABZ2RP53_9BACT|nr:pseudouridine synthase [[Mycoplasma] gypis]MBN0919366.1 rRNA pseudouridine synthase [[Mycoplasma] gypis]